MSAGSFITPLVVEVMAGGKTFKVARQFTFRWKREGATIRIGAGFITDFASIPKFARLIIPKLGRYTKAAVIHDALYQDDVFGRSKADRCFLDAMQELGVVKWKRIAMYLSVRMFGWLAWKRQR